METGEIIKFDQSKHFKFVRELGTGGTGETNLFKPELFIDFQKTS